ncbi:hypothetical protein D7Y11_30815 [Corallococcus sp. AB018]|uniref:hypothetical protein n=1 Tax=Corallococcus sp. AB018 TaxID=2316715 RepID=UPI000F88A526|nr:hypothetical protein [Corallococcus sp. AB018]RUO89316.1 hypothetical protein D7Y11_30815 [Corallococcus sp. AB018]
MKDAKLREKFLGCLNRLALKKDFQRRLCFFADSVNSFEGWLNWELAWAFAEKHPWPKYSATRESRLEDGGLSDLVLAVGREYQPGKPACHVETKLLWANANRSKMLRYAVDDYRRLQGLGTGLMLVVAVSARRPSPLLKMEAPKKTLTLYEKELFKAGIQSLQVAFDCRVSAPLKGEWYLSPEIHIRAYSVEPTGSGARQ